MPTTPRDSVDAARWDAVDEASELIQERRFEEALLQLRDVIRTDPENAYAFHHAGQALYETKALEPARDAYRAAVRVSPDYLGARVALSHVLRELGDVAGALAQAKEALRRFPKDPDAMYAAGLAHAAKGETPAARRELAAFLGTNPELEVADEVKGILAGLGIGPDDDDA